MTKIMKNEHLTVDEILEFISFQKITPDTMAMVSRVNDHILECKECFDKVSAFQHVQDRFEDEIIKNRFNEKPEVFPEEKIKEI